MGARRVERNGLNGESRWQVAMHEERTEKGSK